MFVQIIQCILIVLAALLTVWAQSEWRDWQNLFSNPLGLLLWYGAFAWCLYDVLFARRLRWHILLLPAALALTTYAESSHMALRFSFQGQKAQLEKYARGPELDRRYPLQKRRPPFHVEKHGEAVRILMEERDIGLSGEIFGFARCPQGCEGVDFSPMFYDGATKPEYVKVDENWFAVRLRGSYF